MGIIYPQAVKIRVNGKTIKYYEKLGYKIPMIPSINSQKNVGMVIDRTASFDVSIDDIQKGSEVLIWYYCDCCGDLCYIRNDVFHIHHDNYFEPIYCKRCMRSKIFIGPLHPHWNNNKTEEERLKERNYQEYDDFVLRVLARDNYTCQCCGKKGSPLEVHHLNGYNWDKEHRTDDTNGITLCDSCHRNFHSLYGNGNNTKEQFEEWIGYRIELTKYFGEIYIAPKVYCFENDTIYKNRFEAARILHINAQGIYNNCVGKSITYKGKHFIYYEKYLQMTDEEKNKHVT